MKTRNILISLLSVAFLVACAKGTSSESQKSEESKPAESSQQPSSQTPSSSIEAPSSQVSSESAQSSESSQSSQAEQRDDLCVIEDFGTTRFEAENFNVAAWYEDESYDAPIVEDVKASGGKYLAAPEADSGSQATFSFEIKAFSRVTLYVAYAQKQADINRTIDLSKVYTYSVESVSRFETLSDKKVLATRSSASSWSLVQYSTQELYAGTYNVSIDLLDDVQYCPSIDYVEFKTADATITPVDPSKITEADIPDNDMRNLQQYKYLMDEDIYSYKTYATGGDFSAPRGMKLRFSDVETASTYYVQIAESEAGLDAAPVRETTENKVYTFHNAKLATKYYYRAATSEAGLASADVKNITSTDICPRVVYVPNVLNFRDIGGWESTLVPGAKINQGLYFRCAQLDAAQGSTSSALDNAGKGLAALKELGIKQDIDMRDQRNQPSNGSGPSKANTTDWPVAFVSAPVPSGSESDRWEGSNGTWMGTSCNIAEQYVKIFNALAECDTKPAMLHCTYGADRTGIATFFLESLLGMKMEDMIRDYLWTQFTQGRTVKITEAEGAEFPQWVSKTERCEGDTFADKMENHLISFGIAKSTLEHIREIFVPGYVAQA